MVATGGSASGGTHAADGSTLATGGSTGGATSNTGGTTSAAPDAGGDVATSTSAYGCNLVFGNSTTQQWFDGGFLTYPGIDATRWELRAVAHHYIGSWASSTDSGWTAAFDNGHACSSDAQNPERVVFIVTQSPPYSTAAEYQKDLTAIVNNIKSKYSKVKRIELTTLIRSPGNKETACSSKSGNEQSIPAAEDQGIAAVAADPAFAGLVVALPPFYVTACSDFNPDAPQYTTAGATNIAKVYGAYWAANP
jgi:hypothetical protein